MHSCLRRDFTKHLHNILAWPAQLPRAAALPCAACCQVSQVRGSHEFLVGIARPAARVRPGLRQPCLVIIHWSLPDSHGPCTTRLSNMRRIFGLSCEPSKSACCPRHFMSDAAREQRQPDADSLLDTHSSISRHLRKIFDHVKVSSGQLNSIRSFKTFDPSQYLCCFRAASVTS